ncbi:hypothetical protein [Bacillus sp. FJAT-50079]|uniref:hypothetical protein n=1 Tax=Bacillus sp. FJAT-50079 TaxID=2833577 RepID=UPI001BC977E2|nr:hypothetical protein [Bacillus sp. FJAT-50079]MBS4207461.1 hypothetical protein [Bacillus sp. FJAT-50079]
MKTYLEPNWILDWSQYPMLNREEFHLLNQVVRANREDQDYYILCKQDGLEEFENKRIAMLKILRDYGFINFQERHLKRKLRVSEIVVLV